MLASAPLTSAQTAPHPVVQEAQRLRDAGRLTAAVEILRAHLAQYSSDGDAERLLAQTLYWLHDLDAARLAYRDALERHPEDTTLQLDYARMLVETKSWAAAERMLAPLQGREETRAKATALLGTMAYWRGDWSRATRLFTDALTANADQPDVVDKLREIQLSTSPWMRLSSSFRHDDQPLDHVEIGIETGWFATPLVPITLRIQPNAFHLPGDVVQRVWSAEAAIAGTFPRARLETEVAGGMVRRSPSNMTEWRGRAMVGIKVATPLTIRARAERAPYMHTLASFTNLTTTDVFAGLVRMDHPRGWLGEAGMQVERFPDANRITGQYAWVLGPVRHLDNVKLHAGYAFERRNADESRYVIVSPTAPLRRPPLQSGPVTAYQPYYTPLNLVSHSAAGSLYVRPTSRVAIQVGGSYALHASEDAPSFQLVAGSFEAATSRRRLYPWKADTSVEIGLGRRATLGFTGDTGRTAFFRWGAAGLHLTYRFLDNALIDRP